MSISAGLHGLLPRGRLNAHARFLSASAAIGGAHAERKSGGLGKVVHADTEPYLAHRRIEAYIRNGNRRELRGLRKDSEWIPAVLQGRGEIPDRLLRVHVAPFLHDWETGTLARQRKGKVKFCGPLHELCVKDEDSNEVHFEKLRVLPNNILIHPVTNRPTCVTFVHRPVEEPVRVRVPIRYQNEEKCPGVRNAGYVNRLHWDIDILVQPFVKAPTFAIVDLAGLQLREKRFVKDLIFEGKDAGCSTVLADDVVTTMISRV